MKKFITIILLSITIAGQSQIAEKAEDVSPLLIGEKIPEINLTNTDGKEVSTKDVFNKKTVVIVYRGGWCPYCNSQLADMQSIEKDILALNYQIVAISPDSPSFLKETQGKEKLNYALFSDGDGSFSKAVGIAFAAPEKYSKMLGKYSADKNTTYLPVPTVYVLNDKREIEFMYINPNYATRLKGEVLLSVLRAL